MKVVEVFSVDSREGERVGGCDILFVSWSGGKVIDWARAARMETTRNDVHRCMMGDFR